jgi:hypothetical protein
MQQGRDFLYIFGSLLLRVQPGDIDSSLFFPWQAVLGCAQVDELMVYETGNGAVVIVGLFFHLGNINHWNRIRHKCFLTV